MIELIGSDVKELHAADVDVDVDAEHRLVRVVSLH